MSVWLLLAVVSAVLWGTFQLGRLSGRVDERRRVRDELEALERETLAALDG